MHQPRAPYVSGTHPLGKRKNHMWRPMVSILILFYSIMVRSASSPCRYSVSYLGGRHRLCAHPHHSHPLERRKNCSDFGRGVNCSAHNRVHKNFVAPLGNCSAFLSLGMDSFSEVIQTHHPAIGYDLTAQGPNGLDMKFRPNIQLF